MAHQHRPVAVLIFHRLAHRAENSVDSILFRVGNAQRVERVNTDKVDGGLLDIGAFKRLDVV